MPLTASANMHGMNIMFCSSILVTKNSIPLPVPQIATLEEIVYPKQKPLNATIPSTIGIPITVEPTNHIKMVKPKLFPIDFWSSLPPVYACPLF